MDDRTAVTVHQHIDGQSPRTHIGWLSALIAVAMLASLALTPQLASAAAKPNVSAKVVHVTSYCVEGPGEDYCVSNSGVGFDLLAVSGKRFTPNGPVYIEISNFQYVLDTGSIIANGSGKFTFHTDIEACDGSMPLAIHAVDMLTQRSSNYTTYLPC